MFEAINSETSIAPREQILWTSIRHLASFDVAKRMIQKTYSITEPKKYNEIATNLGTYIHQAYNFYIAASNASSNTSPLLYYYSFMNLAKALCEIHFPKFHKNPNSYSHGLAWKPNPQYVVDMEHEQVKTTSNGIWHSLFQSITGVPCNLRSRTSISVKELSARCPEISSEYFTSYGGKGNAFSIVDPGLMTNAQETEIWIQFSISKHEITRNFRSYQEFLDTISNPALTIDK
ncbi:MAG: YaaC family protein [Dehalogenimonas sp.]